MTKDFRRRLYALISSYIILIGCYLSSWHKNEVSYNTSYEYQSEDPYAYFRNGKIYICDQETIDRIRDDSTHDLYVIDQRDNRDPNMRICNSYEVINPVDMYKLLKILLRYESEHPSRWNRSLITMILEWLAHDASYYCGVETTRTAEVDLNNEDESTYSLLYKK